MELLFEREAQAPTLTAKLAELYGGDLAIDPKHVIANFVASLDGIVALPIAKESGGVVGDANDADRFSMALLRAFAAVIVVGGETYRKAAPDRFTAGALVPELAVEIASFRKTLGLSPTPRFVVVSGSGDVPRGPSLDEGVLVTSASGEARARTSLPNTRIVVAEGVDAILAAAREGTHGVALTEGGPSFFGELVRARLVNELFVTSAPKLLGRKENDGRKSLVNGVDLAGMELELLAVRRADSFLFLRHRIT